MNHSKQMMTRDDDDLQMISPDDDDLLFLNASSNGNVLMFMFVTEFRILVEVSPFY